MIDLPSIEDFRRFARIDHTDDDALIGTLIAAAGEYVETAIGAGVGGEIMLQVERVKLAVLMLSAHWYEQREAATTNEGPVRTVPMHLRSLLHQLRGGRLEPAPEPCA